MMKIFQHLKGLEEKFRISTYLRAVGNDDRDGIYSSPTEVMSDTILFLHPLRGVLAKSARVSHEMAQSQLVLKIAHLANSMNSTPLLEKISSFGVACSAGVFWAGESCLFMFVLL